MGRYQAGSILGLAAGMIFRRRRSRFSPIKTLLLLVGLIGYYFLTRNTDPRDRQSRTPHRWNSPARSDSGLRSFDPAGCIDGHDGVERGFACSEGDGRLRGFSACYAPGTDPAHIQHFEALLSAGNAAAFSQYGRWTFTATNGPTGGNGDPITLTYSFPPDTNTGDPTTSNVLHQTLNAAYGSEAAWKSVFRRVFDDWSALSGIVFVEVGDDGAAWPNAAGSLNVRGDVRIIAVAMDGPSGVLAYNYFPNFGDMAIDKDENWAYAADNYRFMRNIVTHEMGHGLGLQHVTPRDGTKLMEAYLSLAYDGAQDDDVRGTNSYYGDPREPNDSIGAAAPLGPFVDGASFANLSLNSFDDVDWYVFTASAGQVVGAEATPVGASYSVGPDPGTPTPIDTRAIQPLRVEVFTQPGNTPLASAEASAAGQTASTPVAALPAGSTGVLVKVSTRATGEGVQRYTLRLHQQGVSTHVLAVTAVSSTPASIAATPADQAALTNVNTPGQFTYADGQSVTLTAPAVVSGEPFTRWTLDGVNQSLNQRNLTVDMSASHAAEAIYGNGLAVDAGTDVSIVNGESVRLGVVVSGGSAPYAYHWTPSTGLSSAVVAKPLATPAQTTTYNVTVTDAVGNSAADSVLVEVVAPLVASAGDDQNVAAGATFSLSGLANGGTPPYSFTWTPGTALSTAGASTTNGTLQTTTSFTFRVDDSVGRSASDSVTVFVGPPLAVTAGDEQSLIFGASTTLTAQASGGSPPYQFAWLPSGAPLSGDGASISVQPRQTTAYSVTVTDAAGQQTSSQTVVHVTTPLQVAIAASTTTILPGDEALLEGLVTGGAAPYNFAWSPSDGLSSPTSARTTAAPLATTTYTLIVSDAVGQSVSARVQVTVAEPAAVTSPAAVGLCGAGLVQVLPFMLLSCLPLRIRWATRCRTVVPTGRVRKNR